MKGLLIKDFKLIFSNARMLIALVFIAFFMVISSDTAESCSSAIAFLTVISFMFVLTTISYDDFDHGLSFLLTLPINRKTYVREKYCFGLLCGLAGWIFALVICLAFSSFQGTAILKTDFILSGMMNYIVLVFMLALTVPVQIKFGGDNGKIFIFILIGILFVIGFAISAIAKNLNIDIQGIAAGLLTSLNSTALTLSVILLALISLAVSYLISLKIMNHKQL